MIIHNLEQGTPEWLEIRKGKMTASNATAIGNYGKGLDTYILKMMSEYYSSGINEKFVSKDIQRGNELEPIARQVYEFENDVIVEQVGFVEYDEYVGCSPDGLVGEDGGIEIKCVDDTGYLKYLLDGRDEINSSYIWQIQMNLLITGRKWWDLCIYNPNFKKSMCVFRITPDQSKFDELVKGFEVGKELIKNIKNKINE